jgi:hypothetical protein
MSGTNGRNDADESAGRADAGAALDARLDVVPRELPPKRDLWPGIAARLEPRTAAELAALDRAAATAGGAEALPARADGEAPAPRARRSTLGASLRWPYALAAGLGCVALAALLAVAIGQRTPGGAPVQAAGGVAVPGGASGPAVSGAAGDARPSPLLAAAFEAPQDERYRRTRAALEQTFREGLAVLAPETRTRIEQNLEVIRRANADIRAALAADPNSPLLHQLLESTWQQEIDLYTTVGRNVSPALPRTQT